MPQKKKNILTDKNYHSLADVPNEREFLDNLRAKSPQTLRAYEQDIEEFKKYVGIISPQDYRMVARKHVIDWIKILEERKLNKSTVARKLCSLSSLFSYFCSINAIKDNPVKGVNRPRVASNIGKTPAISDLEAKSLLESPSTDTLQGKRDRAILATFLFHGLRRSEVVNLKVKDIFSREGVPFLRVLGKGSKERQLPLHPAAMQRIYAYLEASGNKNNEEAPLFCPLKAYKDKDGELKPITSDGIYKIVMKYALKAGINVKDFYPHSLRATAATNALYNNADLRRVQDWLGHKNIQTTRMYDKRDERPEDSPTFRVRY